MSSIFQDLIVAGKLNVGAGPITHYFRSLPLNAADAVVIGAGPIVRVAHGIPYNAAGEVVGLRATTATDHGPGATPYGPNGEIEGDNAAAAATVYQGVPYTAGGVYATNGTGGAPIIISKDFTIAVAQVSSTTRGYRNSPLAGALTPDNVYGGGSVSLALCGDDDIFYVTPTGNVLFPTTAGNLAVAIGVYQGPTRIVMPWSVTNGRYEAQEVGLYSYMQTIIGTPVLFRLSAAPAGTV